jgi:hypothetical protein
MDGFCGVSCVSAALGFVFLSGWRLGLELAAAALRFALARGTYSGRIQGVAAVKAGRGRGRISSEEGSEVRICHGKFGCRAVFCRGVVRCAHGCPSLLGCVRVSTDSSHPQGWLLPCSPAIGKSEKAGREEQKGPVACQIYRSASARNQQLRASRHHWLLAHATRALFGLA